MSGMRCWNTTGICYALWTVGPGLQVAPTNRAMPVYRLQHHEEARLMDFLFERRCSH